MIAGGVAPIQAKINGVFHAGSGRRKALLDGEGGGDDIPQTRPVERISTFWQRCCP